MRCGIIFENRLQEIIVSQSFNKRIAYCLADFSLLKKKLTSKESQSFLFFEILHLCVECSFDHLKLMSL